MCNFYEGVYKQKWCWKGLFIKLEEFCEEYLQVSLQADFTLMRCHEQNTSGSLKNKMTAKEGH
jgi:hypothetical protein